MKKIVMLANITTLLAGQMYAEDAGPSGEAMGGNAAVSGADDAKGVEPAGQDAARAKCTSAPQQKTASSPREQRPHGHRSLCAIGRRGGKCHIEARG